MTGNPWAPVPSKTTESPRELIDNIGRYVKVWAGPDYPGKISPPEGLRLEMHPTVRIALLRDDTVSANLPFGNDPLSELFKIPVTVNADLPVGGWRLVIVTEDILLLGALKVPEA
jgi:hypothetical protein